MEMITKILVPAALSLLFLRLVWTPIRLGWKWLANAVCGFLCLWLINTVSGFTGISIPINAVTVLIAGGLGIPGMVLLSIL